MADSQPNLGFFKITVADAVISQRFYEEAFGMVASDPIVADVDIREFLAAWSG